MADNMPLKERGMGKHLIMICSNNIKMIYSRFNTVDNTIFYAICHI